MSREINGTKESQIFEFKHKMLIQYSRPEVVKSSGKKKKQVYIPDNNQRGKAWHQKFDA